MGVNAWSTPEELAYALDDARPKVLIADRERLERFAASGAVAGIKVVAVRCEPPPGAVAWSELAGFGGETPDVAVDPDDDMCIFFTSGTTGKPKGAQLTHRGCVINAYNMAFAAETFRQATHRGREKTTEPAPPGPIPAGLITTPLFHVTANNCLAYAATLVGGRIVLMYKWDAGEALRLIEAEGITSMSGVPTMARELLHHPDFGKRDISSLTTLSGGGAQVPPDLVGKIDKAPSLAQPGTGYGMTEACGVITSVYGDFFVDKPESCGPLLPTLEGKCVDDDGVEVPLGGVGELWIKGGNIIKGYINNPAATASTITDGWLHTGDVARIDADGFLFIVDRKKDMILRGGENVYCAEVEFRDLPSPGRGGGLRLRHPRRAAGRGGRCGRRAAPRPQRLVGRHSRPYAGAHRQAQDAVAPVGAGRGPAPERQRQVPEARAAGAAGGRLTVTVSPTPGGAGEGDDLVRGVLGLVAGLFGVFAGFVGGLLGHVAGLLGGLARVGLGGGVGGGIGDDVGGGGDGVGGFGGLGGRRRRGGGFSLGLGGLLRSCPCRRRRRARGRRWRRGWWRACASSFVSRPVAGAVTRPVQPPRVRSTRGAGATL